MFKQRTGSFSLLAALTAVLASVVVSGCGVAAPSTGSGSSPAPDASAAVTSVSIPAATDVAVDLTTDATAISVQSTSVAATEQATPERIPGIADKSTGKLSALLAQLADPAIATTNAEAQAKALGLPVSGAGSLARNEAGAVLVAVRMSSVDEASQQALRDQGATIINVSEPFSTITLYIQPNDLNDVAALPTVENVREELRPQ